MRRPVIKGTKMDRRSQNKIRPAALGALLILVAAGCNRDEVKVYHVETNDTAAASVPAAAPEATPAAMPTTMSGTMPASMPAGLPAPDNSGLPKLQYTLPDGWKEKAPTQMRVASFDVSESGKSVDVSVVPLGGMAGGDFANVNRWRGQLGQPPIDDGALQQLAEKIEVAGQPADLYDLSGTTPGGSGPGRIVAVIFHRDDTVWFFKMTGDADVTEKQKPAFVSFLKTLQFGPPAAASTMDLSQLPPSHPPIDGMDAASTAPPTTSDKPTWTVPAGWQEGPPSQFLVAKYVITGTGDAQADLNISTSAGDGGGLAPNVNRWRGQLGLPAIPEILTTQMDLPGGKADVVDFSGTDARTGKPARIIGVIVPQGAQTWFYKLMGDPDVVAQQQAAFTRFIQSAKYPDAH